MWYVFVFAVKNLFRYSKRTFITSAALAVGVSLFIAINSMLAGFHIASVRNFVDFESGHALIVRRDFQTSLTEYGIRDLSLSIDGATALIDRIRADGFSCTGRIQCTARLLSEDTGAEKTISLIGLDPLHDMDVFKIRQALNRNGTWLRPGRNDCLAGSMLAKKMNLKTGDPVIIDLVRKDGMRDSVEFIVRGTIGIPNMVLNTSGIWIDISLANRLLAMNGTLTGIYVHGDEKLSGFAGLHADRPSDTAVKIARLINDPRLQVLSWNILGKDWLTLSRNKTYGSYGFMGILFLIAAIGVVNTMLMSYFERIRELGMMRALGMQDKKIIHEFVIEGALLGFIGGLAGIAMGAGYDWLLVHYGITIPGIEEMDFGYRVAATTYGVWNPFVMIISVFCTTVFSGVVALLPARKAVKRQVAEVLRNE